MVVIKKLKRSTFDVLSLSKIFGAAILFVMSNIFERKGAAISAGSLNNINSIPRTMKSRLSSLLVLLFFLLLSLKGEAQCTPPGAAGAISGSAFVCQGYTNITYSVPTINNADSYVWTVPSGATFAYSGNSISVNFSTSAISGLVTVYGHSLTCGDGASSSFSVTVNPIPGPAGTITGSASVCQGSTSVNYSISSITNATGYVWTVPSGATYTASTTPTPNITVNYSNTAVSGNVTVYGTNSCGSGTTSTHAVTVIPLVAAAGSISGASTVCQGATAISYTVSAITNATSYIWAYSGTGATITGTTNSVTINFDDNATHGNLTVRGTNSCGNGAVSANFPITISPLPDAASAIVGPPAATVCQGSAGLVYSVPAIANESSYVWSYSGTGETILGNTNSVVVNFSSTATSGNLTVTGRNACGDGVASANYPVVVNPLP